MMQRNYLLFYDCINKTLALTCIQTFMMIDTSELDMSKLVIGVTHDVMVSTSASLACHQCCCSGLSLAWGLNFWALVCGIF